MASSFFWLPKQLDFLRFICKNQNLLFFSAKIAGKPICKRGRGKEKVLFLFASCGLCSKYQVNRKIKIVERKEVDDILVSKLLNIYIILKKEEWKISKKPF